ncbi:MAG: hypothetical protein GF411_09850 [Candidatus Lokiarchaeota archaeon]|nr:hypothetical protein [Candidatus Lokiarchaeota archaeon]
MTEELMTRLHALYLSEEISGYICSKLSDSSVNPGWVESGLILKGFEGLLKDESIQQEYVIPTEQSINLMIDRGMDLVNKTGLIIVGSQGIISEKLAILFTDDKKKPNRKLAIAFRLEGYTPQDIGRLISKYELEIPLMSEFHEPNIDYIEQLKIDVGNGYVTDAFALSMPRGKINPTKWIQESLEEKSDDVIFRTNKLEMSPIFALLFSSWILDFKAYQELKKGIIAAVFMQESHNEMIIWDSSRKYAIFAVINDISLEEITHRYLLSSWLSTKEKMKPPSKTKEVVLETETVDTPTRPIVSAKRDKTSTKEHVIQERIDAISTKIEKLEAAEMSRRLGIIEKNLEELKASEESHDAISLSPDITTMIDVFRKRIDSVVMRLERLVERLDDTERRLGSKIGGQIDDK